MNLALLLESKLLQPAGYEVMGIQIETVLREYKDQKSKWMGRCILIFNSWTTGALLLQTKLHQLVYWIGDNYLQHQSFFCVFCRRLYKENSAQKEDSKKNAKQDIETTGYHCNFVQHVLQWNNNFPWSRSRQLHRCHSHTECSIKSAHSSVEARRVYS